MSSGVVPSLGRPRFDENWRQERESMKSSVLLALTAPSVRRLAVVSVVVAGPVDLILDVDGSFQ
jgi:hypothetical protein